MRVAILDDEQRELDTLRDYLARYAADHGIQIDVDAFSSADGLLADYRLVYDILVLDIDMPGITGMDAARQIRAMDGRVVILFVTNMAQYALSAFEVEAQDYILKPVTYYDFAMKFRRAVQRCARRGDRELVLETTQGIRRLKVGKIVYIEARGHYLIHHLDGQPMEEVSVRGNMGECEALMGAYNFCRVHRSFLANLDYIRDIRANWAAVGREELPVGRLYRDKLIQACLYAAR